MLSCKLVSIIPGFDTRKVQMILFTEPFHLLVSISLHPHFHASGSLSIINNFPYFANDFIWSIAQAEQFFVHIAKNLHDRV